jgi:nucleotide-binding universal stress UspA family protein
MLEIKRILCPVDFSEYSERAFGHAIAVARRYQSAVTAFHVIDPRIDAPMLAPFGALVAAAVAPNMRAQVKDQLQALVASVPAEGIRVDVVVREGRPDSEILRLAGEMSANLVVIATHGRSGFDRLVMGSTAERVLRKGSCPVLTIPSHAARDVTSLARVLCPVDFSQSSMRALQCAMSVAEEAGAALTVLHVARTLSIHDAAVHPELGLPESQVAYERHLRHRLVDFVPAAARAYSMLEEHVTSGKPWREILRVAEDRRAGFIVIGVRGRSSTDQTLFGSTTHHVVRQATCPVLSIRN